jgi:hypothetical protein
VPDALRSAAPVARGAPPGPGMNCRALLTSLAFGLLATPAFAAPLCTNTTDLGTIDAPDTYNFAGTFNAPGQYVDCYTFKAEVGIDGLIHANQFDVGSNKLDIDVTRIELYDGNTLVASAPQHFDFGGLQPGVTYTVALYSDVSNAKKGGPHDDPVSYKGRVEATPSLAPQQVPEPGVLALLGMALVAAGAAVWRSKGRRAPADAVS